MGLTTLINFKQLQSFTVKYSSVSACHYDFAHGKYCSGQTRTKPGGPPNEQTEDICFVTIQTLDTTTSLFNKHGQTMQALPPFSETDIHLQCRICATLAFKALKEVPCPSKNNHAISFSSKSTGIRLELLNWKINFFSFELEMSTTGQMICYYFYNWRYHVYCLIFVCV